MEAKAKARKKKESQHISKAGSSTADKSSGSLEGIKEYTKEISKESIKEKPEEISSTNAIFLKLGVVAVIILIILSLGSWLFSFDPEPYKAESLDSAARKLGLYNISRNILEKEDSYRRGSSYKSFVRYKSPAVKLLATYIATESCSHARNSKSCNAKAIFNFVKQNFNYVAETDNYVMLPEEMILAKGGDCEDFAVLTASLFLAEGIAARLCFVPGHAYAEAFVNGEWEAADSSCKSCCFGCNAKAYKEEEKSCIALG